MARDSSARVLSNSSGRQVRLGQRIGGGGEANVYAVAGDRRLVAKIYLTPSPERAAKLVAMVAKPPVDRTRAQGHVSICWPTDILREGGGACVGFLMPYIDRATSLPVLRLYNPLDRQKAASAFTWEYLLRTATNIASVVEALHAAGYVIGDINESNFLVWNTALVTLVDCDSMQVPRGPGAGVFRCPVGKPEFTAPDLQGCDFSQIDRQRTHDSFALGTLLFLLLMEGVHPYAGVWRAVGAWPSVEERIRHGHSPHLGSSQIGPMPQALPLDLLPAELKSLFTRAFGARGATPARPDARAWRLALERLEDNLSTCGASQSHRYPNHWHTCPWCSRATLLGFDPFPDASQQKPLPPTIFQVPQPTAPPVPARPPSPARPPAPSPTPSTPPAKRPRRGRRVGFVLIAAGVIIWIYANHPPTPPEREAKKTSPSTSEIDQRREELKKTLPPQDTAPPKTPSVAGPSTIPEKREIPEPVVRDPAPAGAQGVPRPELESSHIPQSARVGEPFVITVKAVNRGGAAQQGSITLSADLRADLTVLGGDAQQNGGRDYPAGTPVTQASGGTLTAKYPLAEAYYGSTWAHDEAHHMIVRVTPKERGIMTVWIRATLSYAGERHFSVPSATTDQQGFPARAYPVSVE